MQIVPSRDATPDTTHFEIPRSLRSRRWTGAIAATFLVPLLVSLALLIGIGGFALDGRFPAWLFVIIAVAAVSSLPVVLRLARRDLQSAIDLSGDGLALRGWRRCEQIPYEHVRLVETTDVEGLSKNITRLSIKLLPRGTRTIDLAKQDAETCFVTLRTLCAKAAAIDASGHVSLPDNSDARSIRSEEIVRSLRRRSAFLIALSVVMIAIAVVVAVMLIIDPAARDKRKAWGVVVSLPVASVTFLAAAFAMRREMRRVEAQSPSMRSSSRRIAASS